MIESLFFFGFDKPTENKIVYYYVFFEMCCKENNVLYLTPKKDCELDCNVWYTKAPTCKNTLHNVVATLR